MIVTIIGLGLIGGSFALALKDKGLAERMIGVDTDPEHAAKALELGLVDEVRQVEPAIVDSELI